ncbi:unnamed protein product [Rotaria magnacalcarata]|uniref:AB hydrolase-1 domain-containing protein n=1 Tax=Rotaria magnacalcarata TaxID=392030 RepID=A0A819ZUM3_9BILA|nr:unnamed protein product [Rotaria magnacalcarata]CAF4167639.1 unnamed protein product [Rotaria magnacalcarata]
MQLFMLWKCIFGPKLHQTYPFAVPPPATRADRQPDHIYVKNIVEMVSDKVLFTLRMFIEILRTVWPLYLLYSYYRGTLTFANSVSFVRVTSFFIIVPIYFMILRGIGRFVNPVYTKFINDFSEITYDSTKEARQKFLTKYDFSLSHWKPDYTIESYSLRKLPSISTTKTDLIKQTEVTLIERVLHYPFLLLGYVCVNVFGRRLMFPGSLEILRLMLYRALLDGRSNLIVSYHAKRHIIRTADGNHIDTIFVDARSTTDIQTLVITCEGNAGFYEVGSMMTPIEAGFSVLGWNRPGFGESSGYPGALSEVNAIDAVMRYAIEKLSFPVNNIVIFAWSIGGYAANWAAVNYPNIRGLVLDAIFDDVLPLAQRRMPGFISKLVEKTIRNYLNLNNIQLIKRYNGPFYLVRRTFDEMMNIIPGKVSTNCANEILFSILPRRYPFIYNDDQMLTLMKRYICFNKLKKRNLFDRYCSDTDALKRQCERYRIEHPILSYPCNFGKTFSINERQSFAIYLVDQYLVDFDSQHCTPLPATLFCLPTRCV